MAKTLDEAGVKRLIQEIKGANKNLNAPIPISTENTAESMAQNVKNIADYVEKAKAAGIDTTKSFRLTFEIDGYPVEGSYDMQYSYIYGLQITDDGFAFFYVIAVTTGEVFTPREIVTAHSMQKVTSDMLAQGARNPIIITGDMTEVDEETYQKLSQGGTDVILDLSGGTFVELQGMFNTGDALILIFGYSQFDESNDGVIATYTISINTSAPHTLTLAVIGTCEPVSKSTLSTVLQEIDLTGTDADRKAKLDQFAADWKALTGASDLTGARFVGKFGITDDIERNVTGIMTYCAGDTATEANDNCFYGICNGYSFSEQKSQIAVKVSCKDGSLTITPLFSHLEAITIGDNTPEGKAATKAAIEAYRDNLTALGVDVTKGYMIPIKTNNGNGFILFDGTKGEGYIKTNNDCYGITIVANYAVTVNNLMSTITNYSNLNTTSKRVLPAINEVNALAKGYSTIFTPIELTTDPAQNKTAIDARVAAFTAQGISLTNGCCIPVTYKGVYAGNINLINGDWYGLLVKNTNSPADNINIKLSADGTITEGNSVQ